MTLPLLIALAGCSDPPDAGRRLATPDGGDMASGSRDAPAADLAATAGRETTGGRVYTKACFACHQKGLVGAPRLGEGAAWAPRIEQGIETLVDHAVNGFQGDSGVMPPKGGHAYLTEEEIAAAVEYMVRAAR